VPWTPACKMENLSFLVLFDLMTDTNRVCVNLLSLLRVWAMVLLSAGLLLKAASWVLPKKDLGDAQGWNLLMRFKLQVWPKTIAGKFSFPYADGTVDFGLQVPVLLSSFPAPACLSCCPFCLLFDSISIFDWIFFMLHFIFFWSCLCYSVFLRMTWLCFWLWLQFAVQVSRKPAGSKIPTAIFDIQILHVDGKI